MSPNAKTSVAQRQDETPLAVVFLPQAPKAHLFEAHMTTVPPAARLWQQTTFRRHRSGILRAIAFGLLAATTLVVIATPALGQTTWTGANSADWTDIGNWASGLPAGDTVTIDLISSNAPKLDGAAGTTGMIHIGTSAGAGYLEVINGASLTTGGVMLAKDVGSVGNMLVTGSTTTWTTGSGIEVGTDGQARLELNTGASVSAAGVSVGLMAGSDGTLAIAGAGTSMTLASGITVGQNGRGVLEMDDQAVLQTDNATVGTYSTGSGLAHISGSGTHLSLSNSLVLGQSTRGTIEVDNAALTTAASMILGENSGGGEGIGLVHDAGSRLSTTGDMTIGQWGSGAMTVWNGGEVAAGGTLHLARLAGSQGVLNVGAAAGQAARASGIVNASTVQFGAGTGTLTFNHTDSAYGFASQLLGSGTVNQIAGTTTLTANSQTFAGTTNVTGGKLVVSGRLGGTINVSGSGTLGGAGHVGTIAFGAGGIAAPGNSIGTVLATDVTFNAGSFYDVEVDSAGQSDLIIANTATLNGGTVRVSASPDYLVGNSYNIIHASMGLIGTFTNATTNLAFITPVLSYDGQNAFVTLFQSSNFVVGAETPNQQAVAKALDTLATNNPVVQSMLTLTVPGARQALDNLSGEAHASVRSALLEKSRLPREAAFDRLAHDEEGMWALVEASHISLASDGNAAAAGVGSFDLAAGADAYLGEWLAGLLVHGGTAGLSIPDRSATGTINTIGLGAYAGTEWGATALDLGLDLALHGISTERKFDMGRRFSATLTGNSGATTAQAFGRLSHDFVLPAFVLRPYGEGAYVVTTSGGFTEAGGPAALNVANGMSAALFTTLGLDIERELVLEDGSTLSFGGGLGWRHAFADTPKSTHAFASGDNFTVAGAPLATDALVLEAELGWKTVKEMEFDLSYDGILSNAGQSHVFKATLAGQY